MTLAEPVKKPASFAASLGNVLKIGRDVFPVSSLSEASDAWNAFRDAAMNEGMGPDDVPSAKVCFEGKFYRISWNGRVWDAGTGSEVVL